MKATLLTTSLIVIGCLSVAAGDQRVGVDLMSADYYRDKKGNIIVLLPRKTPFDSTKLPKTQYSVAYADGFHAAFTGSFSRSRSRLPLWPFAPGELEGWQAGFTKGYLARK